MTLPAATSEAAIARPTAGDASASRSARLAWVELVKAVALVWIFLNHLTEQLFGDPLIGNPARDWPPLAERLAQLAPLHGSGIWNGPLNLLRYVGWAGDQGVQLFLIVSGFGLTWGLLQRRNGALDARRFYWDRARRIYPQWWAAHAVLLVASLALGSAMMLRDPRFYLSLLGVRAAPGLLFYIVPAWWYVGLILQLYAVYPVLWMGLRRLGPGRLLALTCAVALPLRGLGLLLLPSGLEAWSLGALFLTRLPEFVFGMSLAAWMARAPERLDRRLRGPGAVALAVLTYAVATLLSLTLLGMSVAPFLLGVSAFVLCYAVLGGPRRAAGSGLGEWLGRHTYSLYLIHQPIITWCLPFGFGARGASALLGRSVAAALMTPFAAVGLEWLAAAPMRFRKRAVPPRVLRTAALMAAIAALLLVGGELAVRHFDPQEALGWGERPSLEADAQLGWRLRPGQRTRLRWESYDYVVTANALGFPGPEYPAQRAAGTLRIMTTGDAFTSAEGVNTEQAWPRLLETQLRAQLHRPVEVLNFAITGYGPNQYAEVLAQFAPVYRPDVIVVGFFTNEFDDVLMSNQEFRDDIGFGRPPLDGWWAILTLTELRKELRHTVSRVLYGALSRPWSYGMFLGQFATLERDGSRHDAEAQRLVEERLRQMAETAHAVSARLVLALIPASVQVCAPSDLGYYPRGIDLHDARRFDLDLPQRRTRAIADELGIQTIDLRPALRAAPSGCPYQRWNTHWTAAGHRVAADAVAAALLSRGDLGAAAAALGSGK